MSQQNTQQLKTPEVYALFQSQTNDLVFLDIRRPEEVAKGTIPGAQTIRLGDLKEAMKTLDRSKAYVVICHSGFRSDMACKDLFKAGFERLSNYVDGMKDWYALGYPTE